MVRCLSCNQPRPMAGTKQNTLRSVKSSSSMYTTTTPLPMVGHSPREMMGSFGSPTAGGGREGGHGGGGGHGGVSQRSQSAMADSYAPGTTARSELVCTVAVGGRDTAPL